MKKKKMIKLLALLLSAALLLSSGAFAASDRSDFSDLSGHWAQALLLRGVEDGLLQGFEDGTLRPDEPITAAQMITLLCRVIRAPESGAPVSAPEGAWYTGSAASAAGLGLIPSDFGEFDAPMARQDALSMLARAFHLTPAAPDLSVLSAFSDSGELSEENRADLAALVSGGYVEGAGGSLNVSSGITRAEFIAVLYRIAERYVTESTLGAASEGGTVLGGETVSLKSKSFPAPLWFDCSATSISLSGVTAKSVTLLSPSLSSLKLSSSSLAVLVLSALNGKIEFSDDSRVETLRADGALNASLDEAVNNIELTGSGAALKLDGSHGSLTISGSGNTVTLREGCVLERLVITGSSNKICFLGGSRVAEITVSGNKNELAPQAGEGIGGEALVGRNDASSVSLTGAENSLTLWGALSDSACLGGSGNTLLLTSSAPLKRAEVSGLGNWLTLTCTDMDSIAVSGSANSVHKCASGAVGSISLTCSESAFRLYTGNSASAISLTGKSNELIVDGSVASVSVDGLKNTVSGAGSADHLTLNGSGNKVSLSAASLTDNSPTRDAERVLALVSSYYAGNYTYEWAKTHDYEDLDKETFVNAQCYSSNTDYLIWVNLAMQRVNVFEGSEGSWRLCYSCIISSGATKSPTPVGVYATTYKQEAGWTTASYTCRPVVGFKTNSGYAFHSILYYPNTRTVKDGSLGFPASHGCIRMLAPDIRYIYDNIPLDTTVVVF